ncbi:MAG: AAA family ATPase [Candidatus Aenigmarchaeota archaeon]|nr:AAA family ATPase [Candidatus Aenigmarchaeota archaeon]
MNYQKFGWNEDPFVLRIDPKLFTGYEEQVKAALNHIESKHKIAIIVGPTGSGKTTMLKWLEANTSENISKLYVSKPPTNPEELVTIFTDTFGIGLWDRIMKRSPNLYNLQLYINKNLKGNQLLFLLDEAHETNRDVLEWLRVLVDQIDSVSLILAGLPSLEQKVRDELQTLDQRVTSRITLTSLSKEDTRKLIQKRIEAAGGTGIKPFTDSAVDIIYQRTGGFPREVMKFCDKLVYDAVEKNYDIIEAKNIDEYREVPEVEEKLDQPVVVFSPKPPSESDIKNLPYRQRQILESLTKQDWLTPTAIVDGIDLEGYASKQHAVRSLNNILLRLMREGYVQREARGKAFMYALTPKVRTMLVQN